MHTQNLSSRRGTQWDAAIAQVRQAVQIDPANADHHSNLGAYCTMSGHLAEAVASYNQALQLRPDFAAVYCNLGYTLYLLGRHEEARKSCERALQLQPDFAEANNHLGLALLALGRADEAAEQLQKAVQLQPNLAEAHRNLATAREEQGRFHEAVACCEQALRLRPGFAEAHSQLGDVFKKLGRFADAVGHMRQALRFKPDYAFVYWNLSQFAAQGLCQFQDAELAQIHALLSGGHMSLLESSLLHLALGNALDRQGAYDAAFSHFRQGKALRKEWMQQNGKAFDSAAHHQLVERLIATFDEPLLRQRRASAASASEVPVFVVGMARSGTTLVEQILSSHSMVAGAGELQDVEQLLKAVASQGEAHGGYPACLRQAKGASLQSLAEHYLGHLHRIGGPALRVIDKKPDNFLHLGLIALLFPQARVIHCRRDPLDVCLSCYFQHFTKVDYSWSLEDLGLYYSEYERLMAHWQRVLPLPVMELHYEDLVARQESVSRELVAFCGLDWEERCLAFHQNPRPVETVSAVQVRRPMYSSSIGRWKKYASHLEPLRRALDLPLPVFPGPGERRETVRPS